MRILLVGSGGREHALAWRLAQCASVRELRCPGGNPGIARHAIVDAPMPTGNAEWVAYALAHDCDLAVIGPEAPLAAGLADAFRAAGIPTFGPGADGARLESSKSFMKELLAECAVPTARGITFSDAAAARAYVRERGTPIVVKADGLAAGKGVTVALSEREAFAAIDENLQDRRFGAASSRIVIEECLDGMEASVFALCDGERVALLPPVEDYKRAFDGDRGPNTGGMGTFAPTRAVPAAMLPEIEARIFRPVVAGLRARGIDYRGVLFAGLMITADGPKVLEFNARFGDPETQVLMPLLQGDVAVALRACALGRLDLAPALTVAAGTCATCVVLASENYPEDSPRGLPIRGIEEAAQEAIVFHAGTARNANGEVVTAGGRVLSIVAPGANTTACRAQIDRAIAKVHFGGMRWRRDIATRSEAQ